MASPAGANREVAARALVWTLLESFGLSGLSVVTLVVLSRYLGPEEFGVASVALAIVQMLVVLVERLFHDPLIQRPALGPKDVDSAFTATLGLGVFLTVAVWLTAPTWGRMIGKPEMAPILQWMSISIFGAALASVLTALHRREMAFHALAVRSLAARSSAAVIAVVMVVAGLGVWSLVAQQVLTFTLSAAALWWLSAVARPKFGWSTAAVKDLLKVGIPTTLQQFIWIANSRVFLVFAGAQLSAAAVGQIALAFRVVDMMRDMLAQAVSQLALPLFARVERDGGDRTVVFIKAVAMTSVSMFPVFACLALMAPEVVEVAFGARWIPAAPYVSMLALLTVHFFPRMFVTPLLSALGRPSSIMVGSLSQTVFMVLMFTVAATHPSPALVMAVWAGRLLISTPIDMWFLKKLSGIGYVDQWRGAFVPALACAVAAAGVLGLQWVWTPPASAWLRLLIAVPLGALLYVAAVQVLKPALLRELLGMVRMAIARKKKSP